MGDLMGVTSGKPLDIVRHQILEPLQLRFLQGIILNNLDPIVVWVQDERNKLHTAICEPLLPVDLEVLKSLTGSINIIDGDTFTRLDKPRHEVIRVLTDMAESLRFIVSIVIDEALLLLRTIVPRQL
jgi:hypothetical protein